jgi:hypothetical protein
VLLLSYGAVGARQPAVRTAAPLPVPVGVLAQALDIRAPDRSRLLLDIIRLVFDAPDGVDEGDRARRRQLTQMLQAHAKRPGETIPLPLDPSIWRETILQRQVADTEIVPAILADRRLALLYHGLAALDDETLAWLGPDRETLHHLVRRPGAFAAFGRSISVKAGRVVVPGGADAERLWETVVGSSVARPGAFVRRLFGSDSGRLPFLYDTIAHLDPPRQRFALGLSRDSSGRAEGLHALAQLFESLSSDWRIEERPFSRPQFDASLTLSLVAVTPDGRLTGPSDRELWELVFRGDEAADRRFEIIPIDDGKQDAAETAIDAIWLLSRIHRASPFVARQRLETFLFAQRMLRDADDSQAAMATALRAVGMFPALTATLERAGVQSVPLLIAAAARAQSLNDIRNEREQRLATTSFQAALGIIERTVRSGVLSAADAAATIASLAAIEVSSRGYEARIAQWIRRELLPALPAVDTDDDSPVESTVLSAMAGLQPGSARDPQIEWEGRRYHVSTARAELSRLRRLRTLQGGPTIDAALTELAGLTRRSRAAPEPLSALGEDEDDEPESPAGSAADIELPTRPLASAKRSEGRESRSTGNGDATLAETLTSVLYAASLGDPDGEARVGGNVALRHDFGVSRGTTRTSQAWRLPREEFGSPHGWRIVGSLLALDVAFGRVVVKRLDAGRMPPESRLTSNERQTLFLTVALLTAKDMTDATRDEIAAALGRGRARIAALSRDRALIERVARDAGLSEWRREALAWTIAQEPERVSDQFSMIEIMWLGSPRAAGAITLNAWGAAQLPLDGCLCLRMPGSGEWEALAGHPAVGLLATRGTDVAIRVAEALAELGLPAALAPDTMAFAMRDVVDGAQPAYFGDWMAFARAARSLSRERITDYVAALTIDGPLLPVSADDRIP